MDPYRICVVCSGNTCRSPMAAAVLAALAAEAGLGARLDVTSAGSDPQTGDPTDPRARAALAARGYPVPEHHARGLTAGDLDGYDLLVAMERGHRTHLTALGFPAERVRLLRSYDPAAVAGDLDVPDPYTGDPAGYARTLELIETCCRGLLDDLRGALGP